MTKKIIWGAVIVIVLIVLFRGCWQVDISKKLTAGEMFGALMSRLGIVEVKVDSLSAMVQQHCVVKEPLKKSTGGGTTTIYREIIREVPAAARQINPEPSYSEQPQAILAPVQYQAAPAGTIVPGDLPGPQDLLFCVDLEPSKSTDSTKKFLFWELVNGLGYSISNVVPNFTGKSANMKLSPGGSADGISFDGEMLRMSVVSFGNWYAQIMGTPMPSDFRPALRSNKSGWNNRLMTRSGDYFVYRF